MKRISNLILASTLGLAGCAGGVHPGEQKGALVGKLASGSFHIEGLTSDGWAIVSDLKAKTVNAVNVATGASQTILNVPLLPNSSTTYPAQGPTALLWHDLNSTTGYGQLTAWSAATGAKLLSASAYFGYGIVRASKDGSRIVYWDHLDANTDALTVDTPSHAAPQVLAKVSAACHGVARFAAGGTQKLVASYCTLPPTGGTSDHVVVAYNLSNGTSVTLQSGAVPSLGFSLDPSGSRALVRALGGAASLVSLDGATRVAVDTGVQQPQFFADGVEMIYFTPDGKLKRICTSGVPEVMQTGVGGLLWMSNDNSAAAYFTNQDQNSGNSDIRIASTVTAGAPLIVNADGLAQFTGYTTDSKTALYYNAVDAAGHVGTFTTLPLGGGPGRAPGSGQSAVYTDWQLSGGKTIFNDQYAPATATTPEHVALEVVDLNSTAPAKQLAANADLSIAVTGDNATLVYTTSDPTSGGLYTVAIP